MRWKDRRESENVEDQRGRGGLAVGGGIGTVLLVLLVSYLTGGDPSQVLNQLQAAPGQDQPYQPTPEEEELKKLVGVVLADTEDVWTDIFREQGKEYVKPKLVVFSGQVQSACGMASAAMGPFYCPEDQKVYIDLGFYDEMKTKFGAPGDFAQAYVIAHEVGHHVQNLLGFTDKVHSQQGKVSQKDYNKLSVRLELQADFLAGVWANRAQRRLNFLDQEDIAEALNAANAIGDDTLQKKMQGRVVPDSFTHGSSEQRQRWFKKGWDTGDLRQGDTFGARNL